MTQEEFKFICSNLFQLIYKEEVDGNMIFWYRDKEEKAISIKKERLNNLLVKIQDYDLYGETEFYNEHYYEVPIGNNQRGYLISGRNDMEKEDSINGITYTLSSPSDEYILLILEQLKDMSSRSFRRAHRGMSLSMIDRFFREDDEEKDLIRLIYHLIPRFLTLRIKTTSAKRIVDFETYCYSFIFNLSYNIDIAYLPLRLLDEITRKIRIGRVRRSRLDDIETPKKRYINDLILYYQRATSSESIDNQFLSFYHVIEHFFEKVYQEDVLESIKKEITNPSFSYKRNKDLNKLIKVIKKRLKYRNEEFLLNEQEALFLTLKKFITDLDDFRTELDSFDPSLIDYYKNTEVSFSKGNKVNLNLPEIDIVFKNLSKRIYKTRNSIVHSKESEFSKYLPFTNDKELIKELFLMRLIAETIIIASSTDL